jgi:hypothetical protein
MKCLSCPEIGLHPKTGKKWHKKRQKEENVMYGTVFALKKKWKEYPPSR